MPTLRDVVNKLAKLKRKDPQAERALVKTFWKHQWGHDYVPPKEQAGQVLLHVKSQLGEAEKAIFLGPFSGEWYQHLLPLAREWELLDAAERFLQDPWDPYGKRMVKKGKDYLDEFVHGVWDVYVRDRPLFVTFEFSPLFGGDATALAKILARGEALVYIGRYRNKWLERKAKELGLAYEHKKVHGPHTVHIHIVKDVPEPVRDAARFLAAFMKSTRIAKDDRPQIKRILQDFLSNKPKEYQEAFLKALYTLAEQPD